jgi:hypothetical protein
VVANAVKWFTRLSFLAGTDVWVEAVHKETGPEYAPRGIDSARTANVDEDERMTLEYSALPQHGGHRRVRDESLHSGVLR